VLVLTRRPSEAIIIANNIKITVVSIGPGRVKLGIEAPPEVRVDRQEIHDKLEPTADVLSALASGEVTSDAPNTMVGHGPDTATIVVDDPSAPTEAGPGSSAAPAAAPAHQAGPPQPFNKHNKFRFPRKPR
jgi:carbon storage regulator